MSFLELDEYQGRKVNRDRREFHNHFYPTDFDYYRFLEVGRELEAGNLHVDLQV